MDITGNWHLSPWEARMALALVDGLFVLVVGGAEPSHPRSDAVAVDALMPRPVTLVRQARVLLTAPRAHVA